MSVAVCRDHASPNHGERRGSRPVDILLLHYTGMERAEDALQLLCDRKSEVSAHYLIDEEGRVFQLVDEHRRAWHAGVSSWKGETDINSRSIGIEIANPGHDSGYPDFPGIQMDATITLCQDILSRHAIPPERVLAHSDVAPSRKADPGEKFPWARLAGEGIGHFVEPAPIGGGRFFQEGDRGEPVEALQSMLALYGYGIGITGACGTETAQVITAFQRHFRPERVDGVADESTITTLHRLLKALPQG